MYDILSETACFRQICMVIQHLISPFKIFLDNNYVEIINQIFISYKKRRKWCYLLYTWSAHIMQKLLDFTLRAEVLDPEIRRESHIGPTTKRYFKSIASIPAVSAFEINLLCRQLGQYRAE